MSPQVEILRNLRDTVKLVSYEDLLRAGQTMTIRHRRGRAARSEQRPSQSFEYIGDAPAQDDEENTFTTSGEMAMEMEVNLQIDCDLMPDVEDPDDASVYPDELEETGLEQVTAIAMRTVDALQDDDSPIRQVADWVSYGGMAADLESTDDFIRVDVSLTVRYRVRSDRPSSLLAQGTQA